MVLLFFPMVFKSAISITIRLCYFLLIMPIPSRESILSNQNRHNDVAAEYIWNWLKGDRTPVFRQRKLITPILPQSKEMVVFYNENSQIAKPNGSIARSRERRNSETAFGLWCSHERRRATVSRKLFPCKQQTKTNLRTF